MIHHPVHLQHGALLGLLLLICCSAQPPTPASVPEAPSVTLPDHMAEASAHAQKRALIVGVSRYADPGHDELHTEGDARLMREALTRHGFTDFDVLLNEAATYDGIKTAFNRMIARSRPGDVVVFHYSGHGVQITDGLFDTNPGDEPDGMDEALVPHDAPFFRKNEMSEDQLQERLKDVKHLRDDEIHTFLEALRLKLGPDGNVAVWFDACYSGTGARLAFEPASRGEDPIGRPATVQTISLSGEKGLFETRNANDSGDATQKAALVVFSSSRHNQKSFEMELPDGTKVGRLSYALHDALSSAGPTTTYQALFDEMQVRMANIGGSQQTPQLEGAAQNLMFSGQAIAAQPHFEVKKVRSDRQVQIEGGMLLGLTEGTRVAFYPIGTHNPDANDSPIAMGSVSPDATRDANVLTTTVDVNLDQPADSLALQNSWAFVTVQGAANLTLDLHLAPSLSATEQQVLRAEMQALAFVNFRTAANQPFDLQIGKDAAGAFLQVPRAPTRLGPMITLQDHRISTAIARQLAVRVLDYGRLLHLKRIAYTQENTGVNVELSVVHPREAPIGLCNYEADQFGTQRQGGVWTLDQNDGFLLKLENKGRATAFFTVLALWPDGGIYQLYPRDAESSLAETRIRANSSLLLRECYVAGPPAGAPVIKVFASRKVPINFRPILTQGDRSLGTDEPNVMDLLFGDEDTRNVTGQMNLERDLNTHAVTLTITE